MRTVSVNWELEIGKVLADPQKREDWGVGIHSFSSLILSIYNERVAHRH